MTRNGEAQIFVSFHLLEIFNDITVHIEFTNINRQRNFDVRIRSVIIQDASQVSEEKNSSTDGKYHSKFSSTSSHSCQVKVWPKLQRLTGKVLFLQRFG